MKVCHLSSVRHSQDLYLFDRICVSTAKAGYETYLVAKGESREDRGVHVIGMGTPPAGRLKRMLFFTRALSQKALELNADLYHIYDPELLPFALSLKKKGKRVIFDSREYYSVLLQSKHYLKCAKLVAALYRLFEQFVFRRIDAVLFPAPLGGKDPFAGISRRTVFIANYSLKEELYDQYLPCERGSPSACFVGIMTPDRGAENMILAAETANLPLILVGDFQPEAYAEKVHNMSGFRYVDFRGILNRRQVVSVYQEASMGLCVIPNGGQYNISDTFNMKVYDYMAMGLPVVLSDSPYAREVMKSYEFGLLVDPSDIHQIAQSMRYLADHPQEAARMGQNGRRAIAEKFHWETQEEKLLDLYRDLIGP